MNDDERRRFFAILDAPEVTDFVTLLEMAGKDPRKELVRTDLAEIDLGSADVAGWDLSGSNLSRANLSMVRNIHEAIFTDETIFDGTKLPEGVTAEDLIKK